MQSFELEERPELTVGFKADGPGVENLAESSDGRQLFGVSVRIRYDGVVLGRDQMRDASPEELAYALGAVTPRAYDREEI